MHPLVLLLVFVVGPTFAGDDRKPLPTLEAIAKLPEDGGPQWNRLIHEKSPYLRQHAGNPVDWYPWGEAAFARAKAENKPIFLSVGYATCHWCHVMQRESFQDGDVAAALNKDFISIKVDREERPDVDQVYQEACIALTGSGGWPLTVFLTPDRKPFFAGTYFPKNTRGTRMGMIQLLERISTLWSQNSAQVITQAENMTTYLKRDAVDTSGDVSATLLKAAADALAENYDATHGGARGTTKFPMAHQLTFLLRQNARTGLPQQRSMVEQTLKAMRRGGIWDHVGLGFHRYTVDPEWKLPHFEKMLYDQALNALAYLEAYQVTRDPLYAQTAREIFTYVDARLTAPEGGFYAAEDAETQGVEGKYYVWTLAEFNQVLGDQAAEFAALFSFSEEGNFEEEATGRRTGANVLYLKQTWAEIAKGRSMESAEMERRWETARAKLLKAREERPRPRRDEKILTDWNGLMIAALARGAVVLNEPEYAKRAQAAADFILTKMMNKEGRPYKRYALGEAGMTGLLEDYAFFGSGLLELYHATFETRYLESAIALTDQMINWFWDEEAGGFFQTPSDGEQLIVRSKNSFDGALPSGNAVAAMNLLMIGRLTAEIRYEEKADALKKSLGKAVAQAPAGYTALLMALDFAEGPSLEIVVAGEPNAADTRQVLQPVFEPYIPNKVVLLKHKGNAQRMSKIAPYTEFQGPQKGKATVYICENFACRKPTTNPKEVAALLEEMTKPKPASR